MERQGRIVASTSGWV